MPTLEIARGTLMIETIPPLRQYGWVVRGVTTHYSLPFRSPAERAHFLRLLAAYFGSAVATAAIEDVAVLLCLYHSGDEAAAHLAIHHLDMDYTDLLMVTPLEEVDEMVGLLLDEVATDAEAS